MTFSSLSTPNEVSYSKRIMLYVQTWLTTSYLTSSYSSILKNCFPHHRLQFWQHMVVNYVCTFNFIRFVIRLRIGYRRGKSIKPSHLKIFIYTPKSIKPSHDWAHILYQIAFTIWKCTELNNFLNRHQLAFTTEQLSRSINVNL